SRRAEIPKADTPPRKRLLLTAPRPRCEVGESSAAAATRQPRPNTARSIREALTKPEAYSKTLEALEAGARIDILEDTGSSS
nr:hypothetical protein [Tanacetum cinerariifolium]